jgi:hypothetical protein
MSLFGNPSYASPGGGLWASKTSGGVVSEAAYVATGIVGGSAGYFIAEDQGTNNGYFIARGDAGVSPILDFQMRKGGAFANGQWAIGMTDAPAGANSGNNFAILSFNDGGAPLSTPLSINRASGEVAVNDLTVNNTLTVVGNVDMSGSNLFANTLEANVSLCVGLPTTAGGGLIEVEGLSGPSRVFDELYNRAIPAQLAPVATVTSAKFNGAQASISTNIGNFTVPRSGMYTLTFSFSNDVAADFGAPPIDGSSIIGASDFVGLTVNQAPGINFSTSVKPWSMPSTTNGGADYLIQSTQTASLITGVTYNVFASIVNISGTLKFSDLNGVVGGGATFGLNVVALC